MSTNQEIFAVEPVLIERRCGGWLAVTPRGWPLGIGVTAESKSAAEQAFREELKRFSEIPDGDE
jgi:hypothetical protein